MAIALSEGRIDDAKALRARQEELVKKLQGRQKKAGKETVFKISGSYRRGHRGNSFHVVQSSPVKQTH